jgi:hypothetical protein
VGVPHQTIWPRSFWPFTEASISSPNLPSSSPQVIRLFCHASPSSSAHSSSSCSSCLLPSVCPRIQVAASSYQWTIQEHRNHRPTPSSVFFVESLVLGRTHLTARHSCATCPSHQAPSTPQNARCFTRESSNFQVSHALLFTLVLIRSSRLSVWSLWSPLGALWCKPLPPGAHLPQWLANSLSHLSFCFHSWLASNYSFYKKNPPEHNASSALLCFSRPLPTSIPVTAYLSPLSLQ